MRTVPLLVTLIAAAASAVSATASGSAEDPRSIMLQRADFPAKSQWAGARNPSIEKSLAQAGLKGRSAGYVAYVPQGGTEELLVSGLVITLPDIAQARRVFGSYKNPFPATTRDVVRLPAAYGDEQMAIVTKGLVRADLRVRTGTTVWRLEIKWAGTERLTRARALAELRAYATKQKRRIGS